MIIFTKTPGFEAHQLAERVRSFVEAMGGINGEFEAYPPVTVSIGISLVPEQGTAFETVISLADAALYQAKAAGRNRVVLWREEVGSFAGSAAA